jgi:6-phosphogluconate dehydrogenase
MQLGMVGLGRMGANMVRRLMRDGHECVVFDVSPDKVEELAKEGAVGATSLADLASKLAQPRAVWVMVPAGEITSKTVADIASNLDADDVIIDGGNSYYRDDIHRARHLAESGIHYVDVGTGRSSRPSRPGWTPPRVPPVGWASRPRPSTGTCTAARPAPATS